MPNISFFVRKAFKERLDSYCAMRGITKSVLIRGLLMSRLKGEKIDVEPIEIRHQSMGKQSVQSSHAQSFWNDESDDLEGYSEKAIDRRQKAFDSWVKTYVPFGSDLDPKKDLDLSGCVCVDRISSDGKRRLGDFHFFSVSYYETEGKEEGDKIVNVAKVKNAIDKLLAIDHFLKGFDIGLYADFMNHTKRCERMRKVIIKLLLRMGAKKGKRER